MAIPGFEFTHEIESCEAFTLRRAVRERDRERVLIKTFAARFEGAARHEVELLQSTQIGGVPRAYELRDATLVLEDAGGMPIKALAALARFDIGVALDLGVKLAAILADLHRAGTVYNNLHPGSILFDAKVRRVQLIDFSLAVREPMAFSPRPGLMRLAYCSPEQTGRINRVCDYRSDFYSLGAVLYEVLTGAAPFQSEDPLELIHCHIARVPKAPAEVDSSIPAPLSQIVMKLLAKTAEDRYQSAAGLSFDLELCAAEWRHRHTIAPFALGARDVSERFTISERLYGREAELKGVLDAFAASCAGATSLMLVAGYSGVGKTSLIHELMKPIARERGYFVTGKFDQLSRDIPYHALIQAFRQLVQQLLAERPERLDRCRNELISALKDNAGVIAEVIPEIELIVGKQPPPAPVAPAEAQNRFNHVFENFVAALAHPSHPLAVFLDDLQWVDSATLNLLEPLLLSSSIRGLFLIGAYRDNEVGADHP